MTLYKNARIEAEMAEEDFQEEVEQNVKEPQSSKEDEVWQKRYGDLRSHSQKREASLKEDIETLKKQMQKISSGEIKPPKSEAEIVQWEREYPDFAQIMDARVERVVESKIKDIKVQTNQIKKDKALMELRKHHPDADEILNSPNFHEWLKKQSAITQNAILKSLVVEDAADVLEKYKLKVLSKKKPSGDDDFEDTRSTARAVRTKSSAAPITDDFGGEYLFSESQIQKADAKWWDANEDKVKKAMREGKVLMDITAGAR
jgi:hypothetical protein